MSFRIFISIFLNCLFATSTLASNPLTHSPQFAQRILAQQRAYRRTLVLKLQQTLQHHPEAKQTIASGFEQFEHKPGFTSVLENIARQAHNPGGLKGHLFEIEKAIDLREKCTTRKSALTILGFSQIRRSPKSDKKREFDIVAQDGRKIIYYECKNTEWKTSPEYSGAQFLDQKEIIRDLGSHYGVKAQYVVTSKQPIPAKWQFFFERHQITTEVN
jgi:hypothetical protein